MTKLTKKAMQDDIEILCQLLTDSHPDPFSGAGGAVNFYRRVDDIYRSLPESLSVPDFLRLLRPIIAAVRDGHTALGAISNPYSMDRIPIGFGVIEDGIYVDRVYAAEHRSLIGSRLQTVNDITVAQLAVSLETLVGCDNHLHVWRRLVDAFRSRDLMQELVHPNEGPLTLTLRKADGTSISKTFMWEPQPLGPEWSAPSSVIMPSVDETQMGWGFSDATRQIVILRVGTLMRYREAGEVWWHSGYHRALQDWYQEIYPGDPPTGTALRAFLADAPAATPILASCLDAMTHANTSWLVVDLRESTGGNSVLANMLGWALFGSEALNTVDDGYQIPRYSTLYQKNYGRLPDRDLSPGGYDFDAERSWQRRAVNGSPVQASDVSEWLTTVPTFQAALADLPCWRPRIVVVTGAHTYSAGFDILLTLKSLGAYHVGVPSAQAPNCFIDSLRFTLPHSRLHGTISFKHSLALPKLDATVRHLAPDVSLTYDQLRAYEFDPAAGVRLALDTIHAGIW